MKFEDIQKIHEAGIISEEQRERIIAHFKLKEEGNRFLVIISFVGAGLVAAGIGLLIASNWAEIPRGVKLAAGLALLLGAHGAGWWLRAVRRDYVKTGEALHFLGSLLFLGNIALVGQIYNLSSRPANAFLLWWVGIAALPWLLRSGAQFALLLIAIGVWFGVEINDGTSPIRFDDERQVLAYALAGLIYVGAGFLLRRSSHQSFSGVAEKLGFMVLASAAYPLTWAGFLSWGGGRARPDCGGWLLPALGALAALLIAAGAPHVPGLTRQWRVTWGATLAGAATLLVTASCVAPQTEWHWIGHMTPVNTIAAIATFIFCLLQVQVGVQQRSKFLVNLGLTFLALDLVASYIGLFGSMAFTGLMFIVSGGFLIGFAVFLEKKRRALMKEIKLRKEIQP